MGLPSPYQLGWVLLPSYSPPPRFLAPPGSTLMKHVTLIREVDVVSPRGPSDTSPSSFYLSRRGILLLIPSLWFGPRLSPFNGAEPRFFFFFFFFFSSSLAATTLAYTAFYRRDRPVFDPPFIRTHPPLSFFRVF